MRVLVTGSTGFIGSRVVRILVEHGYQVRCMVRSDRRASRLAGLPVEQVRGDLFDPESLGRATAGCDACIHLAGVSGWDLIAGANVRDNIFLGTERLLNSIAQSSIGRLVYVSSTAAIDGTPGPTVCDEDSPFTLGGSGLVYAVAKHDSERAVLARTGQFGAVIVNPAETYGADDDDWITSGTIRDILRSRPAVSVHGGSSIAHVDDVAHGIVAALERGRSGERYILGGENLMIREIVRLVLDIAGLRRTIVNVPCAVLGAAAAVCGVLRVRPPVDATLIEYLKRFWFVDFGKAQAELGFRSRSARDVFAPTVTWVQAQLAADAASAVPVAAGARAVSMDQGR